MSMDPYGYLENTTGRTGTPPATLFEFTGVNYTTPTLNLNPLIISLYGLFVTKISLHSVGVCLRLSAIISAKMVVPLPLGATSSVVRHISPRWIISQPQTLSRRGDTHLSGSGYFINCGGAFYTIQKPPTHYLRRLSQGVTEQQVEIYCALLSWPRQPRSGSHRSLMRHGITRFTARECWLWVTRPSITS